MCGRGRRSWTRMSSRRRGISTPCPPARWDSAIALPQHAICSCGWGRLGGKDDDAGQAIHVADPRRQGHRTVPSSVIDGPSSGSLWLPLAPLALSDTLSGRRSAQLGSRGPESSAVRARAQAQEGFVLLLASRSLAAIQANHPRGPEAGGRACVCVCVRAGGPSACLQVALSHFTCRGNDVEHVTTCACHANSDPAGAQQPNKASQTRLPFSLPIPPLLIPQLTTHSTPAHATYPPLCTCYLIPTPSTRY